MDRVWVDLCVLVVNFLNTKTNFRVIPIFLCFPWCPFRTLHHFQSGVFCVSHVLSVYEFSCIVWRIQKVKFFAVWMNPNVNFKLGCISVAPSWPPYRTHGSSEYRLHGTDNIVLNVSILWVGYVFSSHRTLNAHWQQELLPNHRNVIHWLSPHELSILSALWFFYVHLFDIPTLN